MTNKTKSLPELLAPAGSPLALRAAIEAGADAVYIGGISFNARINAKNFTSDELADGIKLAHAYGTKIYIAANTLIFDREREDYLREAERAYLMGADALIVADIGMAREIKKRIPIELHASTQLSGHNVAAAQRLAEAGFSRMVCAREMSAKDIRDFCNRSPIEAEVFVHGALCVSASGQCLFSSLVGGRSGNRGECAQPCRLPYALGKGKQGYPLSLKDLSLARHVKELCDMGVASFKIEGRMKSPEYVKGVTQIWRRLLDEGRNAEREDILELERIFSRDGFTDGYYVGRVDSKMLGVRSQSDKDKSAELVPFEKMTRKIPISFEAFIRAEQPIRLDAVSGKKRVSVLGAAPQRAINAPISRETVVRNLSKLGGTPYYLTSLEIELDDGLMLPISSLNALRRDAIDALGEKSQRDSSDMIKAEFEPSPHGREKFATALFYDISKIPKSAYTFFDRIFVPLEQYENGVAAQLGVMLPEVIFDSEMPLVEQMMRRAKELGVRSALVGNVGHLDIAKKYGFEVFVDQRMNITNTSSAAVVKELGADGFVLSAELGLAQIRDINAGGVIVYGRLPLMLTEKCIGKELGDCDKCQNGEITLSDRRGAAFPVLRRFQHRSAVFNSVPVYMADRADELMRAKAIQTHFIFTVESREQAERIIKAYENRLPPQNNLIRRIK